MGRDEVPRLPISSGLLGFEKMNMITQHIPSFVDTDAPRKRGDFSSFAELLEVPFVKRWEQEKDFHRFSVDGNVLIAELRGGRSWWVVGFLREPVSDLPKWDHGIYEVIDANGAPLDVPGRDVSYSCGDDVGLCDGRVLKRRRG